MFAFGLISTAEFRDSSSSEREEGGESARYEQVGEKMELLPCHDKTSTSGCQKRARKDKRVARAHLPLTRHAKRHSCFDFMFELCGLLPFLFRCAGSSSTRETISIGIRVIES